MAVQDYELLLRVRADLMEAISGLKGLTGQLGGADNAAQHMGETADQAAARIRAMVQASVDQQLATQQSANATRDAAVESQRIVAAYDQQAAAAQRAAAANTDYNRSFRQAGSGTTSTTANTAALAAQRAEMAKLAGQIDPTVNALKRLDDQEKSLNAMRQAGVVGMEDYARFKAVIDANRVSITGAGAAMHTFSLNTAQTRLEMGRLIKDIGTGQWGRLASTGTTLANQAGFISLLFSPLGMMIGAVTASLGAFVVAAVQGQNEIAKLNQAIIQTGNYLGVTSGELRNMAAQITAPFGEAQNTLRLLVQSGKVTGDRLKEAGQAAIDLATVTGENIDKAVASFVKLQDDPVKAAQELDSTLHVLTLTQYENIKALAEQGDADTAAAIAQTAFASALRDRAVQVKESAGIMEKAWNEVRDAASAAWEAMKKVGAPTTNAEDLQSAQQSLQNLKNRLPQTRNLSDQQLLDAARNPADPNHAFFAGDLGTIQMLMDQQAASKAGAQLEKWVADTESENTRINTEAKKASDTIDKYLQSAKSDKQKVAEIAEVKAATAKLIATNPAFKSQYEADEKTALDAIEKKFAVKTPRAPRKKSDAGAIAAQQQLIKLLNDEQGALDPTAKAWADYNNKVAEANKLADKAKTARGADAQAINAQRDAVIANAAAVRDAALDKIIDKDREAWEKLRASLGTPVEVKTDKAQAQLEQLNALMEKLKGTKDAISQADYDDALQRIAKNSITAAPKYKDPTKSTDAYGGLGAVGGLSSNLGGVGHSLGGMGKAFEGLAKNFKAQDDLETWYAEQLAAIAKDRDQDLQHHQLYLAQKAQLDQQYANQSKAIDNARYNLGLSAASNFFGGLANLQHSQNSKMARVGKAAAIAQATINTYQAATGAYSAMASIPYIGPVLGAVAAAAAIVAGLANVAQIRAQPAGYAEGGYTGSGGKYEPAGIVHRGEVIWSQQDVARAGGVGNVEALRLGGLPGFASGGYVPALPNIPDQPGLTAEAANAAAARNAPAAGAPDPGQTHIHVWSMEEAAQKLAEVPAFEKAVVHIVGDNPRTIQGRWTK